MRALLISILVVLTTGCVSLERRVDKYNKGISKSIKGIKKQEKKMASDIEKKEIAKEALLKHGKDVSVFSELTNMRNNYNTVKSERESFEEYFNASEFRKLKKINSKNENYKRFKPYHKELKKRFAIIREASDKYSKSSNKITSAMQKMDIMMVPSKKDMAKIERSYKEIGSWTKEVKTIIVGAESKLTNYKGAERALKTVQMRDIKNYLSQIEAESLELGKHIDKVKQEATVNKAGTILMPGSKQYKAMMNTNSTMASIKKKADKMKLIANSL